MPPLYWEPRVGHKTVAKQGWCRPNIHSAEAPVARVAGNSSVAVIGDSRAKWLDVPTGAPNNRYPMTWSRQFLRSRFQSDHTRTFAVSGHTLANIQSLSYPSAVATSAKTLLIYGGVNDLGANPAASFATLQAMTVDWTSRGSDYCVIVIDDAPPDTGWVGNMSGHVTYRDLVRTLHNPVGGVRVAGTWQAATGGNDGTTPLAGLYMTGDQVHYSISGAHRLSPALVAQLDAVLPAYNVLVTPYDYQAALALGTIAASDIASNRTGSLGTTVASMVTFEGDVWAQMQLTAADGTMNMYRSSSAVMPGMVAGTTKVQSVCEYVLLAGHSNLRGFHMGPMRQSGQALSVDMPGGSAAQDGINSGSGIDAQIGALAPGEHRGYLWSPVALYDGTATQYRPFWITLQVRASLTANATLLVRNLQSRIIV